MKDIVVNDGTRLAVLDWPAGMGPGSAEARAAGGTQERHTPLVLVVHGLGEHAGRYAAVAARLNAAGYPVRAYDQYGHGQSSGPRGGLARDGQLAEHLGEVAAASLAEPAFAGRPLVLLGHSLGGLVVASTVMRDLVRPALLAMSSPALAVKMATWQRAAVRWLPRLAPDLTLGNGLDPQILCRDPKVVADYIADPRVHDRISARLGAFVAFEGARVRAAAAAWTVPTLLLFAGDDRAVDPSGSREFAARAPRAVVRAQCFESMYHEIFNEPDADRALTPLETALAAVA